MERAAFHAGEIALQRQAGVDGRLAAIGPAVIRDRMPQQHRDFFAQLPFLVASALDADGQPWASVLAGPPGFIRSPDERALEVRAVPSVQDPLDAALVAGAPVGLLGIEPHTRRRNRMNGVVTARDAAGFSVAVSQSFGNCPKYIQARKPEFVTGSTVSAQAHRNPGLDDAARRIALRADTFFIATAHPHADAVTPSQGVDVSHRGGKPGFVRVEGDTLTVPDFVGNFFFNTLGNLQLNPRCGLLFIDFDSGDLLQLAARGEIVTDGDALRGFAGAQRLLRLQVLSAVRRVAALPLRWGPAELSPHLQATGAWN